MALDRFMIAPLNEGQRTDTKPWLIPDDAYESLNNAYLFRGKVRKRFGAKPLNTAVDSSLAQIYTRLRLGIGTINGAHLINTVVEGTRFFVGQMFSVGDVMFTVTATGTPADMLSTLAGVPLHRYNTTTGRVEITFADATYDGEQVFFYPTLPVMGLLTYQTGTVNDNPVIAFDTQFAYKYVTGAWQRIGPKVWTGQDSDFFWGASWHGADDFTSTFFVVNFNYADHIQYYSNVSAVWTDLTPIIDNTLVAHPDYLYSARMLILFKNRLIALNTWEHLWNAVTLAYDDRNFVNRARWSMIGSPIAADSWDTSIPGHGDWIDCPTMESIISAQIIKDRLIVYFESCTYELVYTNNEILPFRWQQINSELGAESTFSQISFDKVVLGVGNVGIIACNGANVERIDEKIPQEVYQILAEADGTKRVCGIRDFYSEMVYWSIPSVDNLFLDTYKYPNRVIVYNYRANTWAYNDDSITSFGYFEQADARTWGSMQETWGSVTDNWGSGELAAHPKQIIAGNQEGFTFLVDLDNPRNSISLTIATIIVATKTFVVPNHNLLPGEYVLIENCQGMTSYNDRIYFVNVVDKDIITLVTDEVMVGIYTGGGTMTRVSRISIKTKQYNFYVKENCNASISKVDFLVDSVTGGQVYVDCYPSYGDYISLVDQPSNIGTSILELGPYPTVPLEFYQDQFWHPLYFCAEGESVQFEIKYSEEQMAVPAIALVDFVLNAFTIYAQRTSSRMQ